MHYTAIWAKITGPVPDHPAGEINTRKRIGTDAYPRIGLRVLQKNVVTGLKLLDEVVFKQKGISLGLHNRILGIGNLGYHDCSLASKPFLRNEILCHPFVQVLCLANINDIPLGVIIAIDSGGMWKE